MSASAVKWASIPGGAFAGSDDEAVVDGDFVMRSDELQPVLKAMRAKGIEDVRSLGMSIFEAVMLQ